MRAVATNRCTLASRVTGEFTVIVCYFGVVWTGRMGYDGSLAIVRMHSMSGIASILVSDGVTGVI
jgi:ammonia channel protein AmtB